MNTKILPVLGLALLGSLSSTAFADVCEPGERLEVEWKGRWVEASALSNNAAGDRCLVRYRDGNDTLEEWVESRWIRHVVAPRVVYRETSRVYEEPVRVYSSPVTTYYETSSPSITYRYDTYSPSVIVEDRRSSSSFGWGVALGMGLGILGSYHYDRGWHHGRYRGGYYGGYYSWRGHWR